MAFDNTTGSNVPSIALPVTMYQFAGRLIHWGADGLAFAQLASISGPASRIHLFHVPAE